jgi:hypothetical protein
MFVGMLGQWLGVLGLSVLVSVVVGCRGFEPSPDEAVAGNGGSSSGGNNSTAGGGAAGSAGQTGGAGAGNGGSGADAGSSGAGTGGTGGAPMISNDAFNPDVPQEYVGTIVSPGMEVVAHTIREGTLGAAEWLMAVKNIGTDHLCAIDVQYAFLDAGGVELGSGFGLLDVGLERGSNGTGGLTNCLGPGKVGMLSDTLALGDVDVAMIAKVTHEFGAIILTDAVATDDIKVSGVQPVPSGPSGNVFAGSVDNDSTVGVKNPSVAIYGLNMAGRPLFVSEAIELTTIAAGASWMFETTGKFEEPYASFAAYPDVSDL